MQLESEEEKMAVEESGSKVADVTNKSEDIYLTLMYLRLTKDAHQDFMSMLKRRLAWKKGT